MKITSKLDLRIGEPMHICNYKKDNSPKPVNHRLTLKEVTKVKSDNIRRFPTHDILQVGFTLQTSRANNKGVMSTFNFGYPRLTFKKGPRIESDHTKRFPARDFLLVGLPSQTSRINNKRVISTFKFGYPCLTLNEGSKVKSDYTKRFPAHDFL